MKKDEVEDKKVKQKTERIQRQIDREKKINKKRNPETKIKMNNSKTNIEQKR